MGTAERTGRILAILGLVLAGSGPAAAEEGVLAGELRTATFTARAFSYETAGSLLWLAGPAGVLRLEIRRGDPVGSPAEFLPLLLNQEGDGWTAVLNGTGDPTLNAWGQEWAPAPPGLGPAAAAVCAALERGPDARQSAGPWRAGRGARTVTRRPIPPPGPGAVPDDRLRSVQADLGRGRGRPGEVLELSWQDGADPTDERLRARLTGRPGEVLLAVGGTRSINYYMPEAFVPLWPLAELLPAGD